MDCVKPAYLDKLVTENAISVLPPDPPVKEEEKLKPVTRSGRHKQILENKKKRQDLAMLQREFYDQVKRFEGFIRENEAKEERTDEKFFEELKLKEEDAKEFQQLKQQYREVIPKLEEMEEKVDKYSICESYLLEIASLLPRDYIKMADDDPLGIIMRYNTLADTYKSLLNEMNTKSEQIRELNSQLQSLREEHANRVLTVNSRLADIYKEHAVNDEIVQQNTQKFYQDIKEIRSEVS
ncbi:hypothetical protein ACTXT7_012982 [Hymenolepis weldensis]